MLTLWHGTTSVCSQKVRVGLAEMGLDWESRLVDLGKGEQFAPEYLALNPDAVVPTLIDDGVVVVESSLILEHLDRAHGGGRLMPRGGAAEVAARHWLLRCLAIHGAINTMSFGLAFRTAILAQKTPEQIAAQLAQMPDPVMRAKRKDLLETGVESLYVGQALLHLRRMLANMADALEAGDWVGGGAGPGIADVALVAYVDRLERLGLDLLWSEGFPAVGGWLARMQARPSYGTGIVKWLPEGAPDMRQAGVTHWDRLAPLWKAA